VLLSESRRGVGYFISATEQIMIDVGLGRKLYAAVRFSAVKQSFRCVLFCSSVANMSQWPVFQSPKALIPKHLAG
jgi:hypothetical protein